MQWCNSSSLATRELKSCRLLKMAERSENKCNVGGGSSGCNKKAGESAELMMKSNRLYEPERIAVSAENWKTSDCYQP